MGIVVKGSRILLGLIFTIFGANGVLLNFFGSGFIPMPEMPAEMKVVLGGLMGAVYLMPLVSLIQFVSGLMFLFNRYVNLAIVLLTPIAVNILGLHIFVERDGLPMAIVVWVLLVIQFHNRWKVFKPLLSVK